ncbi:hypothetical protein ACDZ28_13540 [Paenibacillus sp. RS8]|uniref:hypothetical protein n=1 Tax=Paenibacillus sp. RS8 TaxID=3242681 RepID=UPI0035BFA8AA
MAIRPKVGTRVGFSSWGATTTEEKVPPGPWTGEVVAAHAPTYSVKRDADGKVVPMFSRDLHYLED